MLMPKLMNPFFKGMFRKGIVKHLDALASYCESRLQQNVIVT
jgi:hypothetical protein